MRTKLFPIFVLISSVGLILTSIIPESDALYSIPPTPAWKIFNFNDTINTVGNVTSDAYNDFFKFESDSSILFNYTDGTTTLSGGVNGTCGTSGWYSDSSWTKCFPIYTNSTLINADESDFVVFVNGTFSDLAGDIQPDCDDILFTNSTNDKLYHEIVSCDDSTGDLQAHVRVDVSSSSDTELKIFYGNSGASDQSDPDNTWPLSYVMVHHLNSADSANPSLILDSTSNNNDGTVMGTGAYRNFDKIDDYVSVPDVSAIQLPFDGSNGGQIFGTMIPYSDGESNNAQLISKRIASGTGGWNSAITPSSETNGFVKLRFVQTFATNGVWDTTNAIVPLHVPTSFFWEYALSTTSDVDTDPILHLYNTNGYQKLTVGDGLTETTTPVGTRESDVGKEMYIGNLYNSGFTFDGGLSNIGMISSSNGETPLTDTEIQTLLTNGNYSDYSFTGFWPLDELSGTVARDTSSNGNDGTVSGATVTFGAVDYGERPVWDNEFNNHLSYDGVNDLVDYTDNTDFEMGSSDFTIMGWIVLDDYTDYNSIFTKWLDTGNHGEFQFNTKTATGELRLVTSGDGSTAKTREADTPIPLHTPTHVAVTKSGTDATFYINGVADTDDGVALDGTLYNGNAKAYSGNQESPARPLGGDQWDLMVYKGTALSQAQIESARTTGDPPTTTNLILHAKMDETSGTTVNDYSPQGNDGTNNGATITTGRISYADRFTSGGIELEGTSSHVRVPYDSTLSFGDGVNDSAFSMFSVVNMDDATKFRIFSKEVAATTREVLVTSDSGDTLQFGRYDDISTVYQIRDDSSTVTSNENQNISVATSYDASETVTGNKIYLDGSQVDDASQTGGTYVAMHNEFNPLLIGSLPSVPDYADGNILELIILNSEQDSDWIKTMHENYLNGNFVYADSEVDYSSGGGTPITTPDQVIFYINSPQTSILGGVYNFTCSLGTNMVIGINDTGYPVCQPLPDPTSSTKGGVISDSCPTGQYMKGINSTGGLVCDTP